MAFADLMGPGGPPPGAGPGGPPPGFGGGPMGPPEPPAEEGPGDSVALAKQAGDLIRQALQAEPDQEDKLLLEKITTQIQQYIATQQQLVDTAVGAGPGAKLIRKTAGGF